MFWVKRKQAGGKDNWPTKLESSLQILYSSLMKRMLHKWRHNTNIHVRCNLGKQSTVCISTVGVPAKWSLRNQAQKFHTDDVSLPRSGASDWLKLFSYLARPIRSTTQIWVGTCHQYGISTLISQMPFYRETSGGVMTMSAIFSG